MTLNYYYLFFLFSVVIKNNLENGNKEKKSLVSNGKKVCHYPQVIHH